ncbi:Hybrid signal transduction histidine kinase J [Psilocybe cubensis]|uniref:Hybrid signal transduction histidine kinase J n=2 Tax=Psilocybe cubensis TaxID=181762 RepID=A0ACB8GJ56_PSICU|nr:Hybrid signal transduction histidine kinase J [Psilocybe cubensis]KAH9475099.1 Hybrid signal transduction histidine kinase J [Psilocybe cubensis]
MSNLTEHFLKPEASTDAFKAHLTTLLSFYERGPHSDEPAFTYDGPVDSQTEAILRSLEAIAKRMWISEGMVNSGMRSPLDDNKVAELGYHLVHHSEATSSIEGAGDSVERSTTGNEAIGASPKHCPNCGNSFERSPLLHTNLQDGTEDTPQAVPSSIVADSSDEIVFRPGEEIRLLKSQLEDVARVCESVSRGNLGHKITSPVEGGIMAQVKDSVNSMVDNLSKLANDVTRLSRDLGTDGKLGVQIEFLPNMGGQLGDMVDNLNRMTLDVTNQVRSISKVSKAIYVGDLSKQIEVKAKGEILELKDIVNGIVLRQRVLTKEVCRVTSEISKGRIGGRAEVPHVEGVWFSFVTGINSMTSTLENGLRATSYVANAIVQGDLSKRIEVDVEGDLLALKTAVNSIADRLQTTSNEIIQLNRQLRVEGMLDAHAASADAQGVWKELLQSANGVAATLKSCVRATSEVLKAVAGGDLETSMQIGEAQGEVLELTETVNGTVEFLRVFTEEVVRMTRTVGVEGRLGHQVLVSHVGGTWKEIVDGLNGLTYNLMLLVRTAMVALVSVARGDLSQKIVGITLHGEMSDLVQIINEMIDVLFKFTKDSKRIAREGDTEGILTHAEVGGVIGIWNEIIRILALEYDKENQRRATGGELEVW